jgi:DNA-binding GntR family transcriptional regulator
LLYRWYKNILPQIQISQNLGSFYKKGMEEHIAIINYLLDNDINFAIKKMKSHLKNWKKNSLRSLKNYNITNLNTDSVYPAK